MLELTITLMRIFAKPKATPVLLFFIKRNAIAGSIIVKEIQYPFTIGDTSKDLAEFIKPNLMTSKKWIIWVMVPIRCPITSTAMINVNPLFLIFCILFFFFTNFIIFKYYTRTLVKKFATTLLYVFLSVRKFTYVYAKSICNF